MNNTSLKQKWFAVMIITALLSMLMLGSVPAFADVVMPGAFKRGSVHGGVCVFYDVRFFV